MFFFLSQTLVPMLSKLVSHHSASCHLCIFRLSFSFIFFLCFQWFYFPLCSFRPYYRFFFIFPSNGYLFTLVLFLIFFSFSLFLVVLSFSSLFLFPISFISSFLFLFILYLFLVYLFFFSKVASNDSLFSISLRLRTHLCNTYLLKHRLTWVGGCKDKFILFIEKL
jgi:hypothetical protein